jgi:hypothetical protein
MSEYPNFEKLKKPETLYGVVIFHENLSNFQRYKNSCSAKDSKIYTTAQIHRDLYIILYI